MVQPRISTGCITRTHNQCTQLSGKNGTTLISRHLRLLLSYTCLIFGLLGVKLFVFNMASSFSV